MHRRITIAVSCAFLAVCTAAIAQQASKPVDLGPTTNLLSEAKPTFIVDRNKPPKHWTIIAYGDMRFTDPANVKATNPKVRRWLVDKLASEHPDAVLLSGDVPWHGGSAARPTFARASR